MMFIRVFSLSICLLAGTQALAHPGHMPPMRRDRIVENLARWTGQTTEAAGKVLASIFRRHGRPNGYIRGRSGSGSFVVGYRKGRGRLYTSTGAWRTVHWVRPSIGYDFGGDLSQTFFLVYNLKKPDDIYGKYPSVEGSGYYGVGGGAAASGHKDARRRHGVRLVPVRLGVGLRLGANLGLLKITRHSTWNPL